MHICIDPFSLYGIITIMFLIGIIALLYKLYEYCNRRYTLDKYHLNVYYDSDSDSEIDKELNYEDDSEYHDD
jgi:hypothetical protein